ncbi:hypothetical protein GLOIN_2v1790940 [Rhizophagus irregularis DAOM 181602=DAOM 197198]|nr:hypothetical protein GLOIN_2v1790940 [Rhizophagus irregularis DAOM 181602=DAOM 197198]
MRRRYNYNDEMIFSQDNVNSSDTEEEEESDNEYNYEEEEEEEDNNENNDEEEEDEGNNDDNNNQERNYDEEERNNDEEERNNDEEERNNEEEEIHQIVEALDEDKIPFCNGQFAPYFDNYTTTALFCWLQKHNVSTKAYEDHQEICLGNISLSTDPIKTIYSSLESAHQDESNERSIKRRDMILLPFDPVIFQNFTPPSKYYTKLRQNKFPDVLSISFTILNLNLPMCLLKFHQKKLHQPHEDQNFQKSEFWHGNLWGESPLFGQHEILILEVLYRSGDFVYYHDDNGQKKLGRLRSILKNHDGYYQLRIQKFWNIVIYPEI